MTWPLPAGGGPVLLDTPRTQLKHQSSEAWNGTPGLVRGQAAAPPAVPTPESAQCPALPGRPQAREVKALGGGKETHLLQGLGQPLWVCAGHDGAQQRWEQRPRGSAHRVIRKCEGTRKGGDPMGVAQSIVQSGETRLRRSVHHRS